MPTLFFEVSDVARRINRSAATVLNLADRGALPVAARTVRGARLFEPSVVEEYLRGRDRK
jgi:hypothetical protein